MRDPALDELTLQDARTVEMSYGWELVHYDYEFEFEDVLEAIQYWAVEEDRCEIPL